MSDEVIATYDAQAFELAERYDQPALLDSYSPVEDLIASTSADSLALDIGAGSGRDAAWLASKGYEVVAVERSSGMRDEAQRRHEGAVAGRAGSARRRRVGAVERGDHRSFGRRAGCQRRVRG